MHSIPNLVCCRVLRVPIYWNIIVHKGNLCISIKQLLSNFEPSNLAFTLKKSSWFSSFEIQKSIRPAGTFFLLTRFNRIAKESRCFDRHGCKIWVSIFLLIDDKIAGSDLFFKAPKIGPQMMRTKNFFSLA